MEFVVQYIWFVYVCLYNSNVYVLPVNASMDFTFHLQIDWSEGWLVCLVVFHVALTALTLLTRNHHTTQAILFCFLLLSVRCSQTINQYAAENWKRFSRQQYFDSQGMFISVVFSMPVLFNCMMMVVSVCVCVVVIICHGTQGTQMYDDNDGERVYVCVLFGYVQTRELKPCWHS